MSTTVLIYTMFKLNFKHFFIQKVVTQYNTHKNPHSNIRKLPEPDIFEMNITMSDISVSGVGSIHDVTSQHILSS
jgi:hypothetical protein